MGKLQFIMLLQVVLLVFPVGTIGHIDKQEANINIKQSLVINQEFSESDFFYTKLLLTNSQSVPPSNKNLGLTIDTDSQNNIVIGGGATVDTFPMSNSYNDTFGGKQDGFLTKMTKDGDILWSTYIGGSGDDVVTSIAIDSKDNVIVSGFTESSSFPTTNGAFQENYGGSRDIFLAKFNPQGLLLWSTFFGGENREGSYSMAGEGRNRVLIDNQDEIVIGGTTGSMNLPMINAFQPNYGGGSSDAFLAKFDASGQIEWSTYFGGSLAELGSDIGTDSEGNIVIIGVTDSSDFTVLNAHDPTLSDEGSNAFVAKFSSSGVLSWSTHQGGDRRFDIANSGKLRNKAGAVAIDSLNQIIVAGSTIVADNEYTDDAYQTSIMGDENGYIAKYNQNGTFIYGSYFGEGITQSADIHIDPDDNFLISAGSVNGKSNLPNNYFSFSDDSDDVPDPHTDPRMFKFNSTNSLQWITDYMSSSEKEAVLELTMDQLGQILTVGRTSSTNLPGLEIESQVDGDIPVLQIIKLDPINDDDFDGLLNFEEFHSKSSPKNPDTDNDGLTDGNEVHDLQTSPTIADSDNDGLDDKYEVDQQYDPNNNDTDSDGMLDLWEDFYRLDPTDNRDANLDSDFDGLNNKEEFKAGTDPKVQDTDEDGMKDGYEVDNNLNPLKNDANEDKDGDFLPNKFEHDNGLNPDNPIETIIVVLLIIISISAATYNLVRLKRLNTKAKAQGYLNHKEKKAVKEKGFTNLNQLKQAEIQGFKSKYAQSIVQAARYENVEMMIEGWKSNIISVQKTLDSVILEEIKELVNSTTSPIHLHDVESGYKHTVDDLKQHQQDFNSIKALQESVLNLTLIDNDLPFTKFTSQELSKLQIEVTDISNNLNTTTNNLSQIIEVRKQWFSPWQQLLTLIQMTQDGLPIELSKITEVILCSEEQAENLLELLLEENTMIGTYDGSKRVYTKGANISQYIQSMLEKMANFGD